MTAATDWLTDLNGVVKESGPSSPVRGFDGDAWVWLWRERLKVGGELGIVLVDVRLRAFPDAVTTKRIRVEVVAHVWAEQARDVSWSANYTLPPLQFPLKDPRRDEFQKSLEQTIGSRLEKARKTAYGRDRLLSRRRETTQKLRNSGILPE